ncbi:MAG: chromosome segregation protein SMC [Deltaproteobacteria bacterium]|nr:MAG: chromosome segregation protein SMC [Deltaproteobacteria bacterium]
MKIRRLEISGFKSFADRVVFSFDDGVTGVVGPNGCGKSNVVDAIRWAMGEQSAKHLRGRSMEDVIFSGSESRPPTGMAEVSLTFQNDGRLVPPQYASFGEITVTRRLFRSGESSYEINKAACRLLDITELFLGTGVGTRAYSIIEQGRIGLIVSARPEDRRSILEEAAGVTKYKARRKQAERKLESTEQNLLRLSDVVGEVQRRLASLERAAKKAEKFRDLRAELKSLELLANVRRFLAADEQARTASGELETTLEQEKVAQAHVARLESGLSAERLRLLEDERNVQALAERSHAIDKDLRLAEQEIEFAGREREAIAQRRAQHQEESSLLGVRLELLAREEEGHHEDLRKLSDAGAEDEARRGMLERDLAVALERIHAAQRAVEEERHSAVSVLTRLANHRSNLVNLERQRQDLTARREKLAGEAGQLEARGIEISRQRDDLLEGLARSQAARKSLHDRRGAQEEELQRGTSERRETEALLIRLREELADRRSRLTSLLELQKNFEGYGRGVKAILLRDEDERRRDGVYGLVAEVLRTDPAHERAIEAVLGERLQLVLVESHAAGLRAVEYLQKASQGRASFVPLTEMEQLPLVAEATDLPAPEGTVRAIDVVECAPEHERLKRFLLADVFLCDTLAAALSLWANNPGERTFVSADGEVVDREGIVSGGSLAGVADGLLHKRRELQELAGTVQELEARVALSTTRAHELETRQAALELAVKRLAQEEREEELSELRLERDVARLQEDLTRIAQRNEVLRHEQAQLDAATSEVEREEKTLRSAVQGGENEQHEREAKLRALQAELLSEREKAEIVQSEVTRAKVNAAAVAERREGVARALARLAEQRAEIEERREKLSAELSAAEERAAALDAKLEVTRGELGRLLTAGEEIRGELGRARALYDAAQERLRGGDEEVRQARAVLETVSRARAEIELRLQEIRLTLSHLEDGVRERHLVELAEVAAAKREEALTLDAEGADARMQELRAAIEALGEVSLTAIDEAREVGARHAFLSAQKQDLEESIARLRAAIARIERASKERFRETFALVNEKFQQVFPRLFRGGRAELQLVHDPQNPDGEPGVEIVAQPPGKKLVSVNLLSGGEKALTAVSLIFAIFLIKPTPFCLLDEVDAPLDDANVGRYNEMVREMSRTSQFIVITHNKRTMEVADALYGVTMEEPGISKTVSVKLSQNGTTAAA